MIYDSVGNIENYSDEADAIYKAVKFVCEFDVSCDDGKYEIEGDDIFAFVQRVDTSAANGQVFEGHQEFIDVQMVLDGCERHDVVLLGSGDVEIAEEYDSENDVILFHGGEDFCSIMMKPGMFVVYGPADLHRPCLSVGEGGEVRKVCVKIRIAKA